TPVFTAPPYKGNDDTYYLTLTVTDSAGVKSEESTATYTITEDNTLKTKPLHIGPAQTGYGFSWPDQRFELANNADNSKCNDANYDKLTGLMWAKNGSASVSMQWADAKTYAADLSLCGYNDWRLPTVNELASLVNYQDTSSPAKWLNDNGFSNIKSSYYWSVTIYSLSGGYARGVNLNYGNVYGYFQRFSGYVLPVRGPN
ncbi:DUF1566 domain-containing protein, partial [Cysteiniphilum marinum]|uniref:Lcl C-terminal domain-containing protein n=1 Tax=Cysteiniphilum marinum TaxID=2774191 RepID=UPI00193B2AB8